MRYHDNGSGFTVSYSAADADRFNRSYPGSTVSGRGWFAFEANGDIVDASESADDSAAWGVFMDDCRAYGNRRRGLNRPRVHPRPV